jgi:hypothetical protein
MRPQMVGFQHCKDKNATSNTCACKDIESGEDVYEGGACWYEQTQTLDVVIVDGIAGEGAALPLVVFRTELRLAPGG